MFRIRINQGSGSRRAKITYKNRKKLPDPTSTLCISWKIINFLFCLFFHSNASSLFTYVIFLISVIDVIILCNLYSILKFSEKKFSLPLYLVEMATDPNPALVIDRPAKWCRSDRIRTHNIGFYAYLQEEKTIYFEDCFQLPGHFLAFSPVQRRIEAQG